MGWPPRRLRAHSVELEVRGRRIPSSSGSYPVRRRMACTRDHLGQRKRLRHVVVAPDRQAGQLVLQCVTSGQDSTGTRSPSAAVDDVLRARRSGNMTSRITRSGGSSCAWPRALRLSSPRRPWTPRSAAMSPPHRQSKARRRHRASAVRCRFHLAVPPAPQAPPCLASPVDPAVGLLGAGRQAGRASSARPARQGPRWPHLADTLAIRREPAVPGLGRLAWEVDGAKHVPGATPSWSSGPATPAIPRPTSARVTRGHPQPWRPRPPR